MFPCIGAEVVAIIDNDNILKAVYFQTQEMGKLFDSYPELLLINATYKLNDLHIMPLYVVMVVDGNGESEIVSLWITQFDDKDTLTMLVQELKKLNETWASVQCIMSDKDMTERSVLIQELPQAKLFISLFHTLRSMKREVFSDKLVISQAERHMCLEILSKMAYAQDEEMYGMLYQELKQCAPRRVLEYFDKNWPGMAFVNNGLKVSRMLIATS